MRRFIPPVAASAVAGVMGRTGAYPLERRWVGRRRRFLSGPDASSTHHVMSRTAGGAVYFDEVDKEALVRVMRRVADFARVRMLTFCVMGNHFHALVEVPPQDELRREFSGEEGEGRLFAHLRRHYKESHLKCLRETLVRLRKQGDPEGAAALLDRYVARMADVRWWAKEVKERFSRWFNRRHGRKGTLWMERFRSVLVERGEVARTMAAYIDRNPVRAGMVAAASDYPWSAFGRAWRGDQESVAGLSALLGMEEGDWERCGGAGVYEGWLQASQRGLEGDGGRRGSRALGRGMAVGKAEWLGRVYEVHRGWFPPDRRSIGHRIPALPGHWLALRGVRDHPPHPSSA